MKEYRRNFKIYSFVLSQLKNLILIITLCSITRVSAEVVKARMADSLVESVGMCTHFGYTKTPYATNYPEVKKKLQELGIRYIRDKVPNDGRGDGPYENFLDLCKETGIKSTTIFNFKVARGDNRYDTNKIAGEIERILPFADYLCGIEGPNEPDLSRSLNEQVNVDNLVSYQDYLNRAIKATPELKHLPVLGSAMAGAVFYETIVEVGSLGDLSDKCDVGNIHSYPGAQPASSDKFGTRWLRHASVAYDSLPLWCTETGYHNALNNLSGHPPTDNAIETKYLPRLFMTYFIAGIQRTFSYEFVDEYPDPEDHEQESQFGLLNNDCSEKEVYGAMKNMLALLDDAGPAFQTGSLAYDIKTNDRYRLQSLLLQKRDGRYYLVIWNDKSSWDRKEKVAIDLPLRPVTIALHSPVDKATVYHPTYSESPKKTLTKPTRIDLDVPDHLVIIELIVEPHKIVSEKLIAVEDSYVAGQHSTKDENYGNATTILLRQPNENRLQPFWKFDLSTLPNKVVSACLRIPVKRLQPIAKVDLYMVEDDSWDEGTITWSNKPGNGELLGYSTIWSSPVKNEVILDITDLVKSEAASDKKLTITMNCDSTKVYEFSSKEGGNGAYIEIVSDITDIGAVPVDVLTRKNSAKNKILFRDGCCLISKSAGTSMSLNVYSMNGRRVYRNVLSKHSRREQVSLRHLSTGVYTIHLKGKGDQVYMSTIAVR